MLTVSNSFSKNIASRNAGSHVRAAFSRELQTVVVKEARVELSVEEQGLTTSLPQFLSVQHLQAMTSSA